MLETLKRSGSPCREEVPNDTEVGDTEVGDPLVQQWTANLNLSRDQLQAFLAEIGVPTEELESWTLSDFSAVFRGGTTEGPRSAGKAGPPEEKRTSEERFEDPSREEVRVRPDACVPGWTGSASYTVRGNHAAERTLSNAVGRPPRFHEPTPGGPARTRQEIRRRGTRCFPPSSRRSARRDREVQLRCRVGRAG